MNKIRTVIVNNNKIQSEYFKSLLDENTFDVVLLYEEDEAFEWLNSQDDEKIVVLISYLLQKGDGLSLIKRLNDSNKNFAIIFLSSDSSIDNAIEAMQLGAIEFLSKTYRLNENIAPTIKRAYDKHLLKLKNIELQQALERKNKELIKLSVVASETINIVLIYNKNLELEWVNRSFVEIYGYTKDEFVQKFGKKIFEQSTYPKIKQIVEECINAKKSITYTNTIKSKINEEFWLQTTINPIFIDDKFEMLVIIETDITDIKKAERKIIQQQKKIDESLNYAERIQKNIIADIQMLQTFLPNSFIIFKPSEKVSGDIPFFFSSKDRLFLAVIDCTGHGVPGAFLTFMVYSQLINTIEAGFEKAAEIIAIMNQKLKKILHKGFSVQLFEDFEIGLCVISKEYIDFCGVGLSLFFISNNKLTIFEKNSKNSLNSIKLKDFKINYGPGDKILLFSDGATDMLNAENTQRYGSRRWNELIEKNLNLSITDLENRILHEIDSWCGTSGIVDDITIIGVEF